MLADVNKTWYKRVKSVTSQKTNLVEENEKLVAEIISLKKELATENRPLENAKKKFERIINQNYQFFEGKLIVYYVVHANFLGSLY